jgi:hypothetical protein
MRTLDSNEIDAVSGGDVSWGKLTLLVVGGAAFGALAAPVALGAVIGGAVVGSIAIGTYAITYALK